MLVIIRGLPGSGKSTLARMFEKQGYFHVEKDKLRVNAAGEYEYVRSKNEELHWQCYNAAAHYLHQGKDVGVSQVFTTLECLRLWIELAEATNNKYTVIECKGRFGSVHGDDDTVGAEYRAARWEHYPVR